MKPTLLLLTGLALAACVDTRPLPGDTRDLVGRCGAADLQDLVGKPGAVLDGMRFSQDLRVLQPGTAVTMDYSADRLNIRLDARDVIVEVSCG